MLKAPQRWVGNYLVLWNPQRLHVAQVTLETEGTPAPSEPGWNLLVSLGCEAAGGSRSTQMAQA